MSHLPASDESYRGEMSTTRVTGGEAGGGPGDQGAVTALLGHLDTWDKLLVVAGAVSQYYYQPIRGLQ